MHARLDRMAMAAMLVLCASWGVQQVAIKVANAGISPLLQAGLRSVIALLLLWLWSAARAIPLVRRDATLVPGVLAGLLFAGEFALIYWGLSYTSASRSVIFLYTAPLMIALGAHLFVPGERMRASQWFGLACAFAGILAAYADGLRLPTRRELVGDTLVLGAALLWAATTLLIKTSALARVSATKTLFYQLGVSALALPLASLARGEPGFVRIDALILACLLYQGVLVAFASYLMWFWLVTRYPAGRLSAFAFLTPLFGVAAGTALLGERVTGALLAALLLVAAGIYLVNRAPRQPPKQHPK